MSGIEKSTAYGLLFPKLFQIWNYMAHLGVTKVSFYLLSDLNLLRDASEVDTYLTEVVRFCSRTLDCLYRHQQRGLRMRIVGDLDLLPEEVQVKMAQVEVGTSEGSGVGTCFLCAAYTSKVGMRKMAHVFAKAVKTGDLKSEDITPELMDDYLTLCEAPETELWFRSSGEQRFSVYLTLQSGYSYMHIDPKLCPTLQFWDWVRAMVNLQLHWPFIKMVREKHRKIQQPGIDRLEFTEALLRQRTFLRNTEMERKAYIYGHCAACEKPDSLPVASSSGDFQEACRSFTSGRVDMPWVRTGSMAPDEDVFMELSRNVASLMAFNGTTACVDKPPVGPNNEGFANGAAFLRISASLADYAYAYEGSLPISVYIGCCKYDEPRSLRAHFEHSRAPLLKLLRLANRGVRGTLSNRRGEPVAGALLAIQNRTVGFRLNQFGEFWRVLMPGFYMLLVSADGYLPAAVDFHVNSGHVTTLDIKLHTGYKYEG